MSAIVSILNQIFDMQESLLKENASDKFERNINRMLSICAEEGYLISNPLNEKYSESRTDVEANMIGVLSSHMFIVQVVKPIIYKIADGNKLLVQKGIVMVESK
jgi:hypothetical protein